MSLHCIELLFVFHAAIQLFDDSGLEPFIHLGEHKVVVLLSLFDEPPPTSLDVLDLLLLGVSHQFLDPLMMFSSMIFVMLFGLLPSINSDSFLPAFSPCWIRTAVTEACM